MRGGLKPLQRGDGAAACELGDCYRVGAVGLRFSPKQTFHWYSRSALAGDANGKCNLGACYEHGLGCAQSYLKAVKWYRLSAAQRLGTASMNLGYCTLRGHGVPADKTEALRMFRLAVEQGEPKAADELNRLGESVAVDESKGVPTVGWVGASGVPPREDEQIRRELVEVLKYVETDVALTSDAAAESLEGTSSRES